MRAALTLACLLAVACGDDGGTRSVPTGTWRLVGETMGGVGVPDASGALELTETGYALGIASPEPEGMVTAYTLAGGAFQLEGAAAVPYTLEGDELTLRPEATRELRLRRVEAPALDTLPVTGTVTVTRGVDAEDLHVALVRRVRSDTGFFFDPRDDRALVFEGDMAPFDLSRDRGALGTDRVAFGDAFIGLLMVVVYQDRDGDSQLDELERCTETTMDCIRAVSPVVVVSRDQTSPELEATGYALIREGWSHAVAVPDARSGKLGVASLDPMGAYTHDVVVGIDPSLVVIPGFDLTVPSR